MALPAEGGVLTIKVLEARCQKKISPKTFVAAQFSGCKAQTGLCATVTGGNHATWHNAVIKVPISQETRSSDIYLSVKSSGLFSSKLIATSAESVEPWCDGLVRDIWLHLHAPASQTRVVCELHVSVQVVFATPQPAAFQAQPARAETQPLSANDEPAPGIASATVVIVQQTTHVVVGSHHGTEAESKSADLPDGVEAIDLGLLAHKLLMLETVDAEEMAMGAPEASIEALRPVLADSQAPRRRRNALTAMALPEPRLLRGRITPLLYRGEYQYLLGAGSFGLVRAVQYDAKNDGRIFACKTTWCPAGFNADAVVDEVCSMARTGRHDNIVYLVGAWADAAPVLDVTRDCLLKKADLLPGDRCLAEVHIIMELMAEGDLNRAVMLPDGALRGARALTEPATAHKIATHLFRALDYLHSVRGVVHCDIKGANAMVSHHGDVKLVDFARAVQGKPAPTGGTERVTIPEGTTTLGFESPEVALVPEHGSAALDVYSAGVLLLGIAAESPHNSPTSNNFTPVIAANPDPCVAGVPLALPRYTFVVDALLSPYPDLQRKVQTVRWARMRQRDSRFPPYAADVQETSLYGDGVVDARTRPEDWSHALDLAFPHVFVPATPFSLLLKCMLHPNPRCRWHSDRVRIALESYSPGVLFAPIDVPARETHPATSNDDGAGAGETEKEPSNEDPGEASAAPGPAAKVDVQRNDETPGVFAEDPGVDSMFPLTVVVELHATASMSTVLPPSSLISPASNRSPAAGAGAGAGAGAAAAEVEANRLPGEFGRGGSQHVSALPELELFDRPDLPPSLRFPLVVSHLLPPPDRKPTPYAGDPVATKRHIKEVARRERAERRSQRKFPFSPMSFRSGRSRTSSPPGTPASSRNEAANDPTDDDAASDKRLLSPQPARGGDKEEDHADVLKKPVVVDVNVDPTPTAPTLGESDGGGGLVSPTASLPGTPIGAALELSSPGNTGGSAGPSEADVAAQAAKLELCAEVLYPVHTTTSYLSAAQTARKVWYYVKFVALVAAILTFLIIGLAGGPDEREFDTGSVAGAVVLVLFLATLMVLLVAAPIMVTCRNSFGPRVLFATLYILITYLGFDAGLYFLDRDSTAVGAGFMVYAVTKVLMFPLQMRDIVNQSSDFAEPLGPLIHFLRQDWAGVLGMLGSVLAFQLAWLLFGVFIFVAPASLGELIELYPFLWILNIPRHVMHYAITVKTVEFLRDGKYNSAFGAARVALCRHVGRVVSVSALATTDMFWSFNRDWSQELHDITRHYSRLGCITGLCAIVFSISTFFIRFCNKLVLTICALHDIGVPKAMHRVHSETYAIQGRGFHPFSRVFHTMDVMITYFCTLCGFIGMAIARSVFEDAAFYGFVVGFIATRTAFEPLAAASTAAREATDEENWLPSIVQNHVELYSAFMRALNRELRLSVIQHLRDARDENGKPMLQFSATNRATPTPAPTNHNPGRPLSIAVVPAPQSGSDRPGPTTEKLELPPADPTVQSETTSKNMKPQSFAAGGGFDSLNKLEHD